MLILSPVWRSVFLVPVSGKVEEVEQKVDVREGVQVEAMVELHQTGGAENERGGEG